MIKNNASSNQKGISSLLTGWKERQGPLFCKEMDKGLVFMARPLNMESDLAIIHEWVNMDYARRYWQMEGTIDMLKETYVAVHASLDTASFVGCIDDVIVCQMDVYDPQKDILGKYYDHKEGDLGMHLLLGPYKTGIMNFSAKVVMAFAGWFFSCGHVERLVTEPDKNNRASNWLLRRMKFMFMGELELLEKTANLFIMTKDGFAMVPKEFL